MNKIVKQLAVLSMVGLMQIAFAVSANEVSAARPDGPAMQRYEEDQNDPHHKDQDRERQERERHERERAEKERHEHEMKRHPGEDERAWHDRQQEEQRRHDDNMQRLARDIVSLVLDKR